MMSFFIKYHIFQTTYSREENRVHTKYVFSCKRVEDDKNST